MTYQLTSARIKGTRGETIARLLWPNLVLVESGGDQDRTGIDGYLDNKPVQIKYDERIWKSGNIYHELYEKTLNCTSQMWRHSPSHARYYIFVTDGYALLVDINEIALAERNLSLRQISSTSMGFLIRISNLNFYDRKDYCE